MLKQLLLIATFLTIHISVYSTHIVGGEIYYDYLGGNNYKITLKLYRDCSTYKAVDGGAYDNPAYVSIFDGNKNFIQTLSLARPIPPFDTIKTQPPPCYSTLSNACVSEAIYTTTVNLPPVQGGYILTYQRCCRNATVQNIVNPTAVGVSYFVTIPDTSVAKNNSGPHFKNFPPVFLCLNYPISFDHSAFDPDGDSLSYSLCDIYNGGSTSQVQPTQASPPPYSPVPWVNPYSGINPMSTLPALSINPTTGLLTGSPNMIGQWVVGVCVNEYRNGKLIEVHHRDFQFNVIDCKNTPTISVPDQSSYCVGKSVTFVNNSTGGISWHWDFGVNGIQSDTSGLATPTYTYPDTGTYVVTLIANPNTPCSDSGKATILVYDPLKVSFTAANDKCPDGNKFSFVTNEKFTSQAIYSWDFDSTAFPRKSSSSNPMDIVYGDTGVFNVKLHVADHNCALDTSAKIQVIDCRIVVPNVISPNGDGQNETFKVRDLEYYPGSKLIIYNRWGNIIYQSGDYQNNWDAHGISDGTYYYILNVSDGRKGIAGFLTILR